MNWIQTASIAIICFLIARILIEADLHKQVIGGLLSRKKSGIFSLIVVIMSVAYGLSLFFPNTIIVLALLPVIKYFINNIKEEELKKKVSPVLGLALIYSANIGGMGSMTGTPLNLVFMGYIEINKMPGREEITFFSWLMFGVPFSLLLLLLSFMVLRIGSRKLTNEFRFTELNLQSSIQESGSTKKYIILFFFNIALMLVLSGIQFLFKPVKILGEFNLIDLIFIAYLVIILIISFFLPRKNFTITAVKKNIVYFLIQLLFLPITAIATISIEFEKSFNHRGRFAGEKIQNWIRIRFNKIWSKLFREKNTDCFSKNPNSYVSVNRLISDLPFLGLIFMGLVICFVLLILNIGNNPQTAALDGYLVQFVTNLAHSVIPQAGSRIIVILLLVTLCVFVTEFISNTTVLLILIPIILPLALNMQVSPLILLLAAVIGSGAAFMTPVATSVNAVVFGSLKRLSVKRMISYGITLNILSVLWISVVFYFLLKIF